MPKTVIKMNPLRKSILLLIVVVLICAIAAPVVTWVNVREGLAAKANGEPNENAANLGDTFNGLIIYGTLSALDTSNFASKFRFKLVPSGTFALETGVIPVTAKNFTVEFSDAKTVTFSTNQRMTVQEVTLPWDDSEVNSYPFDYFTNSVIIQAYEGKAGSPVGIQIATYLDASAQGFKAEITAYDVDDGIVWYDVKITRSTTTKFFSIFVITILWLIGISALAFTSTFYFLGYTEAPVAALNATLLFAVPNLRNSQPGIPMIGCTADVASFFWVMGLLGINQVLLLTMFFRTKYLKKKEDLQKETAVKPSA
ncbi:hypothetical protein EDD86DRAFT_245649 [Gorgonomyces haynaldii]|nr:hypothetical protein EDD86DRAFT_245649 [Gorgonomyces haynaldii]